jgi:Fe-S cluster assembly protein SufB
MDTKTSPALPLDQDYKYGFVTDLEVDEIPKGLSEEIVRQISAKKSEPEWMLDYRLRAYRHWLTLAEPKWARLHHEPIHFQDIRYYSAPKNKGTGPQNLEDLDPELLKTFAKLGIPLNEQKRISGVAVDAVFDSVSIATTHKEALEKVGVVFCSISEALRTHPELVRKYLGSVVPFSDNYYAALNAAVF